LRPGGASTITREEFNRCGRDQFALPAPKGDGIAVRVYRLQQIVSGGRGELALFSLRGLPAPHWLEEPCPEPIDLWYPSSPTGRFAQRALLRVLPDTETLV
jgi:hypothetical protein